MTKEGLTNESTYSFLIVAFPYKNVFIHVRDHLEVSYLFHFSFYFHHISLLTAPLCSVCYRQLNCFDCVSLVPLATAPSSAVDCLLSPPVAGYDACCALRSWLRLLLLLLLLLLQRLAPAATSTASEKRAITAATTCHTCKLLESWPPLLLLLQLTKCPTVVACWWCWCFRCALPRHPPLPAQWGSIAIHSLVTMIKHKNAIAEILLMRR